MLRPSRRWAGSSSERLADVIDLNVQDRRRSQDQWRPHGGLLQSKIGQSAQSWAVLSPDEQLRRFTAELQKMSASDARLAR